MIDRPPTAAEQIRELTQPQNVADLRPVVRGLCLIAASNVATIAIEPSPAAVMQMALQFERFAFGNMKPAEDAMTFDREQDPETVAATREQVRERAEQTKADRKKQRHEERMAGLTGQED